MDYLMLQTDKLLEILRLQSSIADRKLASVVKAPDDVQTRDWGSDVSTLRITYITLVRPVLEYGYQIFQVASTTNLKKLERVQLSAARIITGLRYCCPTDIVLYEADMQPLTMSFEVNSYIGILT
ncbi:RNase H domain-containing protein [Trichonephila inaurata madagascariensis]|uniref:RNase H domain-containing protein n=1 Tax=Trichonephila inaurata madagascariensis TaxID=2747483 RepID=A0A8X6XQU1_9ARAC|nr:RNase H domain-containing protein [Trichonephila inaurata madagascariensis]